MGKPRKQALTYKGYPNVQNPQWATCPPFESLLTKLNDTNINLTIILGILKLIWLFQGQRLIFSNVVLSIVVQCSGISFPMKQKQHFSKLKANLPLFPLGGSSAQGPCKIKINKQLNKLINKWQTNRPPRGYQGNSSQHSLSSKGVLRQKHPLGIWLVL